MCPLSFVSKKKAEISYSALSAVISVSGNMDFHVFYFTNFGFLGVFSFSLRILHLTVIQNVLTLTIPELLNWARRKV